MSEAVTAPTQDAGSDQHREWPARAFILCVVGLLCGGAFGLIVEHQSAVPAWHPPAATFLFAGFIALALSLERVRWVWSVAASLAIGMLLAFVVWNSAQYHEYDWAFAWPVLSASVASLVMLPLFQTVRDAGAWRLPPERVHTHVWADFVVGVVGLLFVGTVLLLLLLINELLKLVGVHAVDVLFGTDWFGWAVAAAAFGGVAARLRDRAKLLGTLLTIKFTVLAVLAPILAFAIAVFLGALPFGGLKRFWETTGSSTAILLACAVLCVWLLNAVIGSERTQGVGSKILRGSALSLALAVLPLSAIGAAGLWIRVDALGWTPTRLWAVAAICVAAVWGASYTWNIVRARGLDEVALFRSNVRLAVVVAGLAVFFALPLVDFGSISTRSQLARLQGGAIDDDAFDWRALANDFGPAGREALEQIARTGTAEQRIMAKYSLSPSSTMPPPKQARPLQITVTSGDQVPRELAALLTEQSRCIEQACIIAQPADDIAVLKYVGPYDDSVQTDVFSQKDGEWSIVANETVYPEKAKNTGNSARAFDGPVEVRTVSRRQVFVNGEPTGDLFE